MDRSVVQGTLFWPIEAAPPDLGHGAGLADWLRMLQPSTHFCKKQSGWLPGLKLGALVVDFFHSEHIQNVSAPHFEHNMLNQKTHGFVQKWGVYRDLPRKIPHWMTKKTLEEHLFFQTTAIPQAFWCPLLVPRFAAHAAFSLQQVRQAPHCCGHCIGWPPSFCWNGDERRPVHFAMSTDWHGLLSMFWIW